MADKFNGGLNGSATATVAQQTNFASLLFGKERTVLYVSEVAEKLKVSENHVKALIEEGLLEAVNVGTAARKFWRIPASAYEEFLRKRKS